MTVTVVVPTGKRLPEAGSAVTGGLVSQLSVAAAAKSTVAPASWSHSTETAAGQVIWGGVRSSTVITAAQESALPRSSVTVTVTSVLPRGKGPAGSSAKVRVTSECVNPA